MSNAAKRSKAVQAINVALSDLESARERFDKAVQDQQAFLDEIKAKQEQISEDMADLAKKANNFKSNIGTAATELEKCAGAYGRARARMIDMMPEVEAPEEPESVVERPVESTR